MKKINHIYLTLFVLLIVLSFDVIDTIRWDGYSHLFRYIPNLIGQWFYFAIAGIPILILIYLTYKYLSSNKTKQCLQIIFFPLIGVSVFPGLTYLLAQFLDDGWMRFGARLLIINNLILYFLNELLFFWNLRTMKK